MGNRKRLAKWVSKMRISYNIIPWNKRRLGTPPGLSKAQKHHPHSEALASSPFAVLPLEIILDINDFLLPQHTAALALTCKLLSSIFRLQSLLIAKDFPRLAFLQLLERGMPDNIVCPHCVQFHAIENAREHLPLNNKHHRPTQCWKVHLENNMLWKLTRNFHWVVFCMAMKRYRQGAKGECEELLKSLAHPDYSFMASQVSDYRIVGGSLLLRKRDIVGEENDHGKPPFVICSHLGYISWIPAKKHIITPTMDMLQLTERFFRKGLGDLTQCLWCPTEFCVDFKSSDVGPDAMVITVWKDLGDGISHSERKWACHLSGQALGIQKEKYHFVPGSICTAFEHQSLALE